MSVRLPLEIDGIIDQQLEVEAASWFRSARLLVNGKPARKGPKRNQYLVTNDEGIQKIIHLKNVFIDPVPQVQVNGSLIQLVEPLSVFQWIWSALPVILILLGGAIGGAIGGATFWVNTRIFRSEMSTVEQYILIGLASAIAVFVYLILSVLFARIVFG
jgi:hypothetical protein